MKSPGVVNYGPEKFNVEMREVERPAIGADDVLLEVAAVKSPTSRSSGSVRAR